MNDLYELIKRRHDELRGREEDWIDHFVSWWRGVDLIWMVILIVSIPSIIGLFAIEFFMLWKMFTS